MLYEDRFGRLWSEEDVNKFSAWDVENLGLHLFDGNDSPAVTAAPHGAGTELEPSRIQELLYARVRELSLRAASPTVET